MAHQNALTSSLQETTVHPKRQHFFKNDSLASFYPLKERFSQFFHTLAGIFKDENSLLEAKKLIDEINGEFCALSVQDTSYIHNTNLSDFIEFGNILNIATLYTDSALLRTESRGSHNRSDFPQTQN